MPHGLWWHLGTERWEDGDRSGLRALVFEAPMASGDTFLLSPQVTLGPPGPKVGLSPPR